MWRQTAILGAGVMGETLLSGLVRAGRRVDQPAGRREARRAGPRARGALRRRGGRPTSRRPRKADTVALVVKPQDMGDVLDEIAPDLRPGQLLVSLAAGITTAFIESRVPEGVAVVRVMPNTPALVDEGMAAISPGSPLRRGAPRRGRVADGLDRQGAADPGAPAGRRHRDLRLRPGVHLLRRRVDDRGRRPPRPAARRPPPSWSSRPSSARPTMLRETGTHPIVLREQVTSPGGTTAAALRELEIHKVRAAFLAAMEAARDRSRELAEGS